MKEYDVIELVRGNEKLKGKGIEKGCNGVLIAFLQKRDWMVMFLNPENLSDYAVQ